MTWILCCTFAEKNGEYSVNPRDLSTGLEAIPPSDLPLPVYAKPLPPVPNQAVLTPYALTSSMSEGYSGSIPYPNDNVPNSFGIAYSTFDSPNGYAIPLASLGQPGIFHDIIPVSQMLPNVTPAIPPCFRACPACPCRRRVMMASRFKRQSSNDASCQCTKCTADGQAALGTILARTKREYIKEV
ncbi:unnamed protein product [Toxocara canis]|uniref:DM domain-containing protein n=1 Tax=Toxocara canis TaxID=6265 RepID=A0A183USI8_TOXCA|nr:unnamed protein product [Toxocara canis]